MPKHDLLAHHKAAERRREVSEDTKIQWCDHTFNPWIGCTKVSTGCANCYAETLMDHRYGKAKWGKGQPRVRTSAANWKLPLRWNAAAGIHDRAWNGMQDVCDVQSDTLKSMGFAEPRRPRVFCGSLCDWLDDEVPIEWLADLLHLIKRTPNLNWLLLTKRPENWRKRMRACTARGLPSVNVADVWLDGSPPPNLWLGVSAEDQKRWDERVPVLLSIPAAKRFVSVEPMLGQINMGVEGPHPDWVIFGGESGPGARACNVDWIRDGVRQCKEAGVAAFVKQLGARPVEDIQDAIGRYVGFQGLDLKDRKGGDPAEWPADLRVREWPGGVR
jgi:protein gp37